MSAAQVSRARRLHQRMIDERQAAEDARYIAACDLMIREQHAGAYSDELIAQVRLARDRRQARLDAYKARQTCDICHHQILPDELFDDGGDEIAHTACIANWFRSSFGREALN